MGGLLPLGQMGALWRGGSEINALWHGGDEIWRRQLALNNTGLDPATANIMTIGASQSVSFLYDYWTSYGKHGWSNVFRPSYSGTFYGYSNDTPDVLPGLGVGAFFGPWNNTPSLWANNSYPTGNNPKTDMANFDALTIWESSNDYGYILPTNGFFETYYPWDTFNKIPPEIEAEYQFALTAANAGVNSIYLVEPWNYVNNDNWATASVRSKYRKELGYNIKAAEQRLLYIKRKLVANGHPDVNIFIIPMASVILAINEQYENATVPAEVLSYAADARILLHRDEGGGSFHAYLPTTFGAYMDWCVASSVWFAQSPAFAGTTEAVQGGTIPTAVADWIKALAWNVCVSHPYCGLGEPLPEIRGWEPYLNEPLNQIVPLASTALCALNSTKLDTTGGEVTDGEEVAQIADFVRVGTGPVMQTGELVFDVGDQMDQDLTGKGHTARTGAILFSLGNVGTPTTGWNGFVNFEGAGLYLVVNRNAGGSSNIGLAKFGTGYRIDTTIPEAWFDGRPLLMMWRLGTSPGEQSSLFLKDCTNPALNNTAMRGFYFGRDWTFNVNATEAQIGATKDGVEAPFELQFMAAASDFTDKDFVRIMGYIQTHYGIDIWEPSVLFGS